MAIKLDISTILNEIRANRFLLQTTAKKILPQERVSKCLRFTTSSNVDVYKHLKTNKAFYGGLQVCGSVWHCPVCSAKISERRREELKKVFDQWKEEGGKMAFLTLTFRHSKGDSLKDILFHFREAQRKFKSGRKYQEIKSLFSIEGSVTALEITYSDFNGFHPHSHEIIFYKNNTSLIKMKNLMWLKWKKALNDVGLTALKDYGLTLQSGEMAQNYLSKFGEGSWSLESEMTKGHIKKGKNRDSLTPFDFLRFYFDTDEIRYKKLFEEYARVFKGRNQLVWSKGFKKRFNIEEKTDQELANEKIELADLLGQITLEEWKLILKYDYRSRLLENIEKYGYDLGKSMLFNRIKKLEGDKKEISL